MNYTNVCRLWRVAESSASPRELLTTMLQEVLAHVPADSLGHAKGYAQYPGGAVFASTTVVPPEIRVQKHGEFGGGELEINLALIFSGLSRDILESAVAAAHQRAEQQWGCGLIEILGEIDVP